MLDAALACDDETLIALAQEYPRATDANWDGRPAEELLGLPGAEEDEDLYAILARLLAGTRWCTPEGLGVVDGAPTEWPAVAGDGTCATGPQDWQDAVDAGAITAQESDAMQGPGSEGYEGWRLTITADGEWQQLVDGYLGPPRG